MSDMTVVINAYQGPNFIVVLFIFLKDSFILDFS